MRSSHGHFVKASGLRWLAAVLLTPVPFAGCVWALPFLTVLCPSEHYSTLHRQRHMGVETQRQWSDQAIARTTPVLLGLFSLIALWATRLANERNLSLDQARWYAKPHATFSDALASVRRELWTLLSFATSGQDRDMQKIPADVLNRLMRVACRPP